jgi:hypothetical protein
MGDGEAACFVAKHTKESILLVANLKDIKTIVSIMGLFI